ncbi:MAG TPA: glycosyltransferase family 4 protein [Gemmatimonadales bacterium]|nr:glycosyltransferase family 4 protein [Gemmatimonadales bacterium]
MARIAIVTHVVHPHDGQGRVNYELTRYLATRGHQVTLIASEVEPTLLADSAIRWEKIGVPRRAPDAVRWLVFAVRVWWRFLTRPAREFDIVQLNGAIAPVRGDVNTCHFVHASWRRMPAPHRGGVRGLYQRLVTGTCAWCERRAYRSAGRVIAVSDLVRDALITDAETPADRIQVIYNGVDLAEFRPRTPDDRRVLRGPLAISPADLVVLFVGDATSPRKNLDLTLRAVAHAGPRFELVVVGRHAHGPYPALAERLGIAARVHFLGPRPDVAECLRDADIVFCASHYEPASLVLLEAMASARPVIVTPTVGNAAFIVDRRNGFLLRNAEDLDGAVRVLVQLAHDPELRLRIGRAARETARFLDWRRMGRQYEEVYTALLDESRTPAGMPASLRYEARSA